MDKKQSLEKSKKILNDQRGEQKGKNKLQQGNHKGINGFLYQMDGNGYILDISKKFWIKYKDNITPNNNLFYTWQYDIRWAATELRKNNIMVRPDLEKGLWTLA